MNPLQHQQLVQELVQVFEREGFRILRADLSGYLPPEPLPNDGYGDQKPKTPDVFAFDPATRRHIIGIVKTEGENFETEEALTEYNVFLDQIDRSTGTQATLYILLPADRVPEFNTMITHYIHRDYWKSLVVVASMLGEDP